jgi:hypothetical protein
MIRSLRKRIPVANLSPKATATMTSTESEAPKAHRTHHEYTVSACRWLCAPAAGE